MEKNVNNLIINNKFDYLRNLHLNKSKNEYFEKSFE